VTTAARVAALEEAPALAALINAAFEVERFFVEGDRTSAAEVGALMAKGAFLVAEAEGALSACVYVETRGRRGYFGLLAVDPRRRGSGLGRALVAAAEDHLRVRGCEAADIHVVNLRTELPPFYRRLGYAETGTVPFPEGRATQPCHFIRMSKPLAAPAA
jgi:ribosomal protein S18 acetylase RimI-like enzyme